MATQCLGKKQDGTRCGRTTNNQNGFCTQHHAQVQNNPGSAVPAGAAAGGAATGGLLGGITGGALVALLLIALLVIGGGFFFGLRGIRNTNIAKNENRNCAVSNSNSAAAGRDQNAAQQSNDGATTPCDKGARVSSGGPEVAVAEAEARAATPTTQPAETTQPECVEKNPDGTSSDGETRKAEPKNSQEEAKTDISDEKANDSIGE